MAEMDIGCSYMDMVIDMTKEMENETEKEEGGEDSEKGDTRWLCVFIIYFSETEEEHIYRPLD
jgi:hypothetical protein